MKRYLSLGFNKGWKGRPPSGLGLYLTALFIAPFAYVDINIIFISIAIFIFAWFLSVVFTKD